MRPTNLQLAAAALFAAVVPSAPALEITHGPVLGGPGVNQMKVWARTDVSGRFFVRYGVAPNAMSYESERVLTSIEKDNTGIATLRDLVPGSKYHYQVIAEGKAFGPGGTFHTLPDPALLAKGEHNPDGLYNFKFEFACGNNQSPGDGLGPSLPAYNTLLDKVKDEVDFAILNGDWLYEEKRDYPVADWLRQVGVQPRYTPEIVRLAPSIVGTWENYKVYLDRALNLAEWHRHVPTVYTVDDHELINDVYGCATTGFQSRRSVFRDIGVRAWFDYLAWANPVEYPRPAHFGRATLEADSDILVDENADFAELPLEEMANLHVHWGTQLAGVKDPEPPAAEGDPNHNNYRIVEVLDAHRLRIEPKAVANGKSAYSIGRRTYGKMRVSNCEFFLLDTRSHRDLHDFKNPENEKVSMLGKRQLKWLKESMSASDADFFFVVSSVNFMIPHVGGGGTDDFNIVGGGKDDAWTVFLNERESLIEHWDQLKQPVFVLTGDLHNSFAIKITDNVYEFASGPHNSVNHRPVEDEGNRPANGPYQYGPRPCEIRWSSYVLSDIPRQNRLFPHYCVVQVNNVFNSPVNLGGKRRVAFPRPHVIFRFYDGLTGEFAYAETIFAGEER